MEMGARDIGRRGQLRKLFDSVMDPAVPVFRWRSAHKEPSKVHTWVKFPLVIAPLGLADPKISILAK